MPEHTPAKPDAPPAPRPCRGPARPNAVVVLDSAWAERLGVRRVGGVYRIRRRDLVERLTQLQQRRMDLELGPSWLQNALQHPMQNQLENPLQDPRGARLPG